MLPLLVAVVSLVCLLGMMPFYFVGDDGGITLRYAERIAEGRGYDYNDGEAVNGSSNPLWTLVLSALLLLGLPPGRAVFVGGSVLLALSMGGLARALQLRYGWAMAVGAVLWLAASQSSYAATYSGLESPLSVFLAVLLIHALAGTSRAYVGLVLGLLVANKVDGALAAIAYTAVVLLAERRFPWKEALFASLAAAPMALLLSWQFGSVIPNSAITKAAAHATAGGFDPGWVLSELWRKAPLTSALSAASLALLPVRAFRATWTRELTVLQAWLVLHVGLYSVVDMGDRYPWYVSVPIFLTIPISVGAVHGTSVLLTTPWRRAAAGRRALVQAGTLALPVVSFLLAFPHIRWRFIEPRNSLHLPDNGVEDLGRLAAGAWLCKHTSGTELLCTPYGLPSFAYRGPVHDYSGLNSRPDDYVALQAMYYVASDDTPVPEALAGLPLQARFRYGARGKGCLLLARPASEIVRGQMVHFLYPLEVRSCSEHPVDVGAAPRLVGPNEASFGDASCLVLAHEQPAAAATVELSFELLVTAADGRADAVELSIRTEGGVQYSREHRVGAQGPPVSVEFEPVPPGPLAIHLQVSAGSGGAAGVGGLSLRNLSLRSGEPLAPADFPVLCRRWQNRIGYVAAHGFPSEMR